jgi:uncharacterized protein YdeI (YjbR/CyaY-like superfamily)
MEIIRIEIFDKKEFRNWLNKNHDKETKVGLIIHKKHTGENSPSHRELMEEAICFGWIDTIIKKLDEDKYIRFFSRRNKNSRWSYNTLGYAEELIKNKRMTSHGLKFYEQGKRKLPHDHGLEKNPNIPKELEEILNKNEKTKLAFERLAPSQKKMYLRWLLRAKRPETREKRVKQIVKVMSGKKIKPGSWQNINKDN